MNRYLIVDYKENVVYSVNDIIINGTNFDGSVSCIDKSDLYRETLDAINSDFEMLKNEKKKYLKDMNNEEIKHLLSINKKLEYRLNNDFLEIKMDEQVEEMKNILGNNYHNYIKIQDHYNTFYMRLTDWERFIDYLNTDYLINEDIKMYNMIQDKREQLKELDFYSDEYNTIYEECEKLSIKLLESIENYLHTYEQWEEDEMINYFQEMEMLNDYYVEIREDKTSDNVIRLDINYTDTFI